MLSSVHCFLSMTNGCPRSSATLLLFLRFLWQPICSSHPFLRLSRFLIRIASSLKTFLVTEKVGGMEGRVRRNGAQVSPERCIVWTEPSGKHRMQKSRGTKVPVVYYLCKNSLLEHPHFIEVPFSSPEGLYLRDVINRLIVLRGNHMPTLYSWSCKRSYRNGFVWQDLAVDDLIIPAQGNDYILKGSLLLNEGSGDGLNKSNNNNLESQKNLAHQQKEQSAYSRNEEASSSISPAIAMREMKSLSPARMASPHPHCSTAVIGSSSSGECRALMPSGTVDASTETDDGGGKTKHEPIAQNTQIPMAWNAGMGTLVSLIRAEVEKLNGFNVSDEKGLYQSKVKIKKTNALLQLISCGSILKKIGIS